MTVTELINILEELDPKLPVRVAVELANGEGVIKEIREVNVEGSDTNDSDYDVLIEV